MVICACSGESSSTETDRQAAAEAAQAPGKGSLFGKSPEEKIDAFLSDYTKDLKAALAETDDERATRKLKAMQEKYQRRAEKLKPEMEAWEKSLSASEKEAMGERFKDKPYFKELMTVGFSAMGRFAKNPEMMDAFEELNKSIDVMDDDGGFIGDSTEMEEEE